MFNIQESAGRRVRTESKNPNPTRDAAPSLPSLIFLYLTRVHRLYNAFNYKREIEIATYALQNFAKIIKLFK